MTKEEVTNGSTYKFLNKTEIEIPKFCIEEAKLYFLVDSQCDLIINDNIIGNFVGFSDLHERDIKEYLVIGTNKIEFIVKNNPLAPNLHQTLTSLNELIDYRQSPNKYGLIYHLEIT